MGDFNIDLLNFENHSPTSAYIDCIFGHGLMPLISKPTRVDANRGSATLINHLYMNILECSYTCGLVITDMSDHYGVFAIAQNIGEREVPKNIIFRSFNEANMAVFRDKLSTSDYSKILFAQIELMTISSTYPVSIINRRFPSDLCHIDVNLLIANPGSPMNY